MQKISSEMSLIEITPDYLKKSVGKTITNFACIHKIRKNSGFSFVYLRTGRFILQSVYIAELCNASLKNIVEGTYIEFTGTVKEEVRADCGYEITLTDFNVLSSPSQENPINISDKTLGCTLETNLLYRYAALRHPSQRAILKISEGITDGFAEYMKKNNFTKIYSPKILSDTPTDTANLFRLKYFGNDAVLAHNSIFAKQSAVAAYDRIYEITHAYRADKHNSTRHLNEYIKLDFEISFINDICDIMNIQTAAIKHIMEYLKQNYSCELELLDVKLPQITTIPSIAFTDALNMLGKSTEQLMLDPTDERNLSEFAEENHGCDFIFVTNLPSAKQPFYIADCNGNKNLSESFILLYKGREIAYGGQKIHDYAEQKEKLEHIGANYNDRYLDLHRCGLPPHGGAGIGLERFIAGLLNLENIKEAALFPQDMHHLMINNAENYSLNLGE